MDVHPTVAHLLTTGFVQLSKPQTCLRCGTMVHFVGEHKANGNWYCPVCGHWASYSSEEGAQIELWKRAQHITDHNVLFSTEQ